MAFGTPYLIGSTGGTTTAAQVITSGTATTAGDTIIVDCGNSSAAGATITSVTDTKGNTYAAANSAVATGEFGHIWIALNTTALAVSDTITITFSTTTGSKACMAIGVSGVATSAAVDQAPAGTHATSTAPSVTSGTLSQATEMAIGVINSQSTGGVPSGLGSFTSVGSFQSGSSPEVTVAYLATAATTAVTFSGTIVSSNWCAMLITLLPASGTKSADVAVTETATITAAAARGTTAAATQTATAAVTAAAGLSATAAASLAVSATVTAGATVTSGAAVTVAATWTGSYAPPNGFFFPYPSGRGVQIPVANTAGDWMFAIITWRQPQAGAGPSMVVADDAHNYWEPLGPPTGDSSAAGVTRTAIWYAPAARAAQFVLVSPTGPVVSFAAIIADVSGLSKWFSLTAITPGFANAASALLLGIGAPSSQAMVFSALGTDNNSASISNPGAGWTALPTVSASNGVDHTVDIQLNAVWKLAAIATSAAWSSSAALDLSGVTAGILVTAPAPAQPNPNWPVTITEVAPGAGTGTPPSQTTWVALSPRSLAMDVTQGRQYMMGQLQAGQGTLTLDNPDGALIPPGTGIYAGIDSGTPVRQRMIIPSSATPYYVPFSGYFQRWPFALEAQTLRGQTQATIQDIWAYAAAPLDSMARQELAIDGPYALWPLDDPAGSTSAANIAAGNPNALMLTTSKYGSGGATVAFGANSGALAGNSTAKTTVGGRSSSGAGGMFSQTLAGTSQNTNGYGYALVATDTNYPPVAAGVTIEMWFQVKNGTGIGFTAATSGSLFFCTAGYTNGTPITMSVAPGFTIPGGFAVSTVYYVISASGNNFQLSASLGGGAITVTSAGGGFCIATTPWNSVIWSARNIKGPVVEIDVSNTTGALILLYTNQAGAGTQVVIDSTRDYRVMPLIHVSVAFNQNTYRVLVGAGSFAAVSGSFSAPVPAQFTEIDIGGIQGHRGAALGYAWSGYSSLCDVYPLMLQPVRVINHFSAAGTAITAEAACDRIERILEYALLTGRRCLLQQVIPEEGDLCVSGKDIGGQPAATSVTNIGASTLPAMPYVAPTGDIFYLAKYRTWNQPVKWVLGDGAGEIPCTPAPVTDYDPARVVNDIQLTQLDTSTVTIPGAGTAASANAAGVLEAASQLQYGDQPYQVTGYLQFDTTSPYGGGSSLGDLANWLAWSYAAPHQRVQSVTVDASRHPSAWPFVAGVSVGDMVTVNLRPPTAAPGSPAYFSVTARVTQTQRSTQYSQQQVAGSVTCVLDYAAEQNTLMCDDAVRGLLNGKNVLGW